jgi:hypothetical protein
MSQFFESADGSRRNLRIALFAIILLTLPFYCIGFVLWSVAPQTPGAGIPTRAPSSTPQTREPSPTAGVTDTLPPFVTPTGVSPLLPTPIQFNTPADGGGIVNPIFPTSEPPTVFIPPPTVAPTLTFVPPPPTNTPPPPPTITPIPPSPIPPPTIEVATSTTIPFPTDTETPTPTDESFSAGIEIAPENQEP